MNSMEVFEPSECDKEILHLLAEGEQEIAAGYGYDLEAIFTEADALLGGKPICGKILNKKFQNST
jgi:hypothetical protein